MIFATIFFTDSLCNRILYLSFLKQRRIVSRTHNYYYGPIEGTPFSLAIALPEPYGLYRSDGKIEVKLQDKSYVSYFAGENWRVHPDWVYCWEQNPSTSGISVGVNDAPEEMIRYFLDRANRTNSIRWRSQSAVPHVVTDQLTCKFHFLLRKKTLIFLSPNESCDPFSCFQLLCFLVSFPSSFFSCVQIHVPLK